MDGEHNYEVSGDVWWRTDKLVTCTIRAWLSKEIKLSQYLLSIYMMKTEKQSPFETLHEQNLVRNW